MAKAAKRHKKEKKATPLERIGAPEMATETDIPKKVMRDIEEYARENGLSKSQEKELLERARTIYRSSLYDPEEAVGVVAAQSLSEPTTQMSVDYNERIIIKEDGNFKLLPIGQFTDRMIEVFGSERLGRSEVCDLHKKGIFVPSLDRDEKIQWKRVLSCSRHRSPEKLLKIETMSGRSIVATDSHSFVIRKDNKIVPIAGKELIRGDRIPVVRKLPVINEAMFLDLPGMMETGFFYGSELKTKPLLPAFGVTDQRDIFGLEAEEQIYPYVAHSRPLPARMKLDGMFGWLAGIYLAEGNATKYYISISNTKEEILSRVREFAGRYNFTFNEYDNYRGFSRGHDLRINSSLLSSVLERSFGTGSYRKKIPEFVFNSNEGFICSLLRGYFDGDGNVDVKRRYIRVSSRSGELIDGIALLLSRLGIFASKTRSAKDYGLVISYKYAPIFMEKIGFFENGKMERLKELCKFSVSKDFIDMIPGIGNILYDVAKRLGFPTRYVNNFTKRQIIGREILSHYIEKFQNIAKSKGIDIGKEIKALGKALDGDVVWDKVVKISHVKPEDRYVYDLSVPGLETFTTSEGIITHNTMRTYHFAGTAGIQVTLGLPRLLEIFDARKEPKTPTMTIYLDKDYQSPEKARKVAENIKEVRLRDVIVSDVLDLTNLEIRCRLDTLKLARLEIPEKTLPKNIKLRNINIKLEESELVASSKSMDLKNLRKLKYRLLETHIKGIKGISQAVVNKEEDEWIINTLGSNLRRVFEINGVDSTRTVSNNIFEILDVLGIEAARNIIIRQSMYTIEEQGLGVDVRYTMLLADLMTVMGNIRAIGRYGVAGQKASVLARAAFEETKNHLVKAAIRGERDYFRGVVENIMVNQIIPVGTGAFQLKGWIPEKGKEASK